MKSRWLLAAWLSTLALAAAACGGSTNETSPSSLLGAEAVAWREARYAAGHAGVENLSRFFDQHVVVEHRAYESVFRGRRSYLKAFGVYLEVSGTQTSDPAEPMSLLLSAEGMLDQYSNPWQLSMAPAADDWMIRARMGPHGYTHVVMSTSAAHWRSYWPTPPALDGIEGLANRYVALWNGAKGVDVADVYGKEASVKDTLAGLSLSGSRGIRAAVGSEEWPDVPRMEIVVLPEVPEDAPTSRPPRGPAIYFGPAVPGTTESDELVLLLQVDDGSGCPGVVGAAMAVKHDRITREQRYHEVESLRRCFDTGTLKPGWWEGINIPEPVLHELTGTVTWSDPSRSVEVYNGTSASNEYVRWGLERFAVAGMTLPKVDSVTFVTQQSECPLGRPGYSRYDDSGGDIFLCFQADQADASGVEQTLLHELAHVWMRQNIEHSTEQAFMKLVGVSRWEDPNDDWDQRGVEQAANTMMFGLSDEPMTMEAAGCEGFVAEFRLLSGVDPLAPCFP